MAHMRLREHGYALAAAVQFLTRIPVPLNVPFTPPVLTRSIAYFPVAGLAIGTLLAAASWLLSHLLPPWPTAVLLVALWAALTGGLHLDGWMDTADGVLSHRSRERMLDIMKDSRVGAMGVLAAVLLLMLKASLIAELLTAGDAGSEAGGIPLAAVWILTCCWSRSWMGAAIAWWKPARQGEGMANLFNGVNNKNVGFSAILSLLISFAALMINDVNCMNALMLAAAALILTALAGTASAASLNRKLGGLTGDTYGAMNEALETLLLLAVVIWRHIG
ncbi:adenosylcobinamide-GDP ribazoletransferase [Paenibacillus chungangensis]|uniref:Adenosylcobinamide-GDP ribazoletransferase n=1 Tax=Paenibacillus chungangensis TaxID=696535 RepID=A0ABW3HQ02_9BACL